VVVEGEGVHPIDDTHKKSAPKSGNEPHKKMVNSDSLLCPLKRHLINDEQRV
jgi:hypothetical protein